MADSESSITAVAKDFGKAVGITLVTLAFAFALVALVKVASTAV